MSIMLCPSCGAALLTLNKPCWQCGMLFTPDLECPVCHKLEHDHLRQCPPRKRTEQPRVLCPLCGGKRHRHEIASSVHECLWRQCFTGKAQYDVESDGVPSETEITLREFADWISQFDDGPVARLPMAGCVDAERILRQRARQDKKGAS